jgi:hypothetical protein
MQKLGMKPVPGVTRVTIKKSKNVRSSLFGVAAQCLAIAPARSPATPETLLRAATGAGLAGHARCAYRRGAARRAWPPNGEAWSAWWHTP